MANVTINFGDLNKVQITAGVFLYRNSKDLYDVSDNRKECAPFPFFHG
jgi:hypothetical protein